MSWEVLLLLLVLIALPPRTAVAQDLGVSAVSRIDTVRTVTNAAGSGGVSADFRNKLLLLDVHILGETPTSVPWTVGLATNGFYTTNAGLNGLVKVDDYFLASTALVAYEPKLNDDVAALFSVRQDVFRYDRLQELDFELLEASTGATFRVPGIPNTVATLRYVYTNLTADGWDRSFFQYHAVAAGVHTSFRYSQTFRFVVGLESQVSLAADPGVGRRDDYSVTGALVCEPIEHLQITAGYSGSFFDYGFAGREDFNHVFRAGLVVRPKPWLWIGVSVAYTFNRSNLDAFDYNAWTSGVGAGIEFHF